MKFTNAGQSGLDDMLRKAGARPDTGDQLRRAASADPRIAQALARLTDDDIKKIGAVLNDKEAVASIMATAQAQELLKKLKR